MNHNRMLWGIEERYIVDGMERIKTKPKRSAYDMHRKVEFSKGKRIEEAIQKLKERKEFEIIKDEQKHGPQAKPKG